MTDYLTDSDDEKAAKELLCQAMDTVILEQIAAINIAGFSDSYLPSHLETRFQNLKSFQSSTTKPANSLPPQSFNPSHPAPLKRSIYVNEIKNSDLSEGKNGAKTENGGKKFEQCGRVDNGNFSPSKKTPRGNLVRKEKKSHFSKFGCILCSLNKMPKRKSNENGGFDSALDDKFLSDISNFSVKNHQKMMKKAMKNEEKIRREAEKIVKSVKHASAWMNVSDIAN